MEGDKSWRWVRPREVGIGIWGERDKWGGVASRSVIINQ